jgi:hypothetical protein
VHPASGDEEWQAALFPGPHLHPSLPCAEFLKPTLLVGLFAPPEELSAAVVIETLYFYALGHQNDFDVCWQARCTPPVCASWVEGGGHVCFLAVESSLAAVHCRCSRGSAPKQAS